MSRFVRALQGGGKNGVEEGRFVFISGATTSFNRFGQWVSRVVKMKGSLGPRENST